MMSYDSSWRCVCAELRLHMFMCDVIITSELRHWRLLCGTSCNVVSCLEWHHGDVMWCHWVGGVTERLWSCCFDCVMQLVVLCMTCTYVSWYGETSVLQMPKLLQVYDLYYPRLCYGWSCVMTACPCHFHLGAFRNLLCGAGWVGIHRVRLG